MRVDGHRPPWREPERPDYRIMPREDGGPDLQRPILQPHPFCGIEGPGIGKGEIAPATAIDFAGGFLIPRHRAREAAKAAFTEQMLGLFLDPCRLPRKPESAPPVLIFDRPGLDGMDNHNLLVQLALRE